jgi:hypothetical protein
VSTRHRRARGDVRITRKLILGALIVLVFVCAPDVLTAQPLRRALGVQDQTDGPHLGMTSFWTTDDTTSRICEDGPWGRMVYRSVGSTFGYRFKGEGLRPGVDYTLIYWPQLQDDHWPTTGICCLGSATATEVGYLEVARAVELDSDLPMPEDISPSARIGLVQSSAVDCTMSTIYQPNPAEILFAHNPITFTDTDPL